MQGLFSTDTAFAALTYASTVVVWGNVDQGGNYSITLQNLRGIDRIYSTGGAFAAVNSTIVWVWGDPDSGGVMSKATQARLQAQETIKIYATWRAFAALMNDGSVVSWGNTNDGGYIPSNGFTNGGVKFICANQASFTAVKNQTLQGGKPFFSWGNSRYGGSSTSILKSIPSSAIFSSC